MKYSDKIVVRSSSQVKLNLIKGPSAFTGATPLVTLNDNYKYPKHLLVNACNWFVEFCINRGLNYTKYKDVDITFNDPTYQVDFFFEHTDIGFSLYQIYYNSKNKKIMQATWELIH